MKKFASLLLTVVMLATMLTVFAVPTSAAAELVSATEDMTISGNRTYFSISVNGKRDDSSIIVDNTNWKEHYTPCTLTIESGATITSDYIDVYHGCNIIIKRGASVKCDYLSLQNESTLTIESGASLTCRSNLNVQTGCTATVKSGASVMCRDLIMDAGPNAPESAVAVENGASFTINGSLNKDNFTFLDIGGTFTGKDTYPVLSGSVTLLPGGTVDVEVTNAGKANELVAQLQKYDEGAKAEQNSNGTYRVTAHRHIYTEEGICCGKTHLENTAGGTGSTPAVGSALSEGNLTIIIGIAAAVVFGLGGFILGTKKKRKTAVASGTDNTDEE